MELYYNFADISFKVSVAEGLFVTQNGILSEFQTDPREYDYSVNISENGTFPPPEGECVFSSENRIVYFKDRTEYIYIGSVSSGISGAYMYIRCFENENTVLVRGLLNGEIPQRILINSLTAVHAVCDNGGVLFHSSFIKIGKNAILFTAPSGVGKSTQAQLWCDFEGAELINGDRSVLYPGRACGVPYCGSSGVSKKADLPLRAIVYLSQAPADSVKRLYGVSAFRKIWEGCSVNIWNKNDVEKAVQTVSSIVSDVPVYHLSCTKQKSAVDILKRELGLENE